LRLPIRLLNNISGHKLNCTLDCTLRSVML
jgi:hypothetical protein